MTQTAAHFSLLLAGALGLVSILAAYEWARQRVRFRVRSSRLKQQAARAIRGEQDAEVLLEQHGFHIVDRQVNQTYPLVIDETVEMIQLRADLLVEKEGHHYIAEVKTGRHAPQATHAPTRRQLCEYAMAYDVAEVLLVDMETRSIRNVRFPLMESPPAEPRSSRWLIVLVTALVAALYLLVRDWS